MSMTRAERHRRTAEVISVMLGGRPGDWPDRSAESIRAKTVWYGVMRDACPQMALKELMVAGGRSDTAHSSALTHVQAWQRLPWKDRFGWLVLVEGMVSTHRGKNGWTVAKSIQECLEAVQLAASEMPSRSPRSMRKKVRVKGHYDER
ncbi:MAG: hypothetical protein CMI60_01410 [Parvibaculum sp.]|nr:hypothetical protein [Parvibaculum sp.]